jgi:serine/threonine/tyrosine-interacting protein
MQAFDVTQEKAFEHVQARRFCIAPNQNFSRQLEAFQHIHEASLAISRDAGAGQDRVAQRRRRNDDSEDEDEMERCVICAGLHRASHCCAQ